MIIVALLVTLALVASVAILSWRRRQLPQASLTTTTDTTASPIPQARQPEVSLAQVPGREDIALVLGESTPTWLAVEPLLGATDHDRRNLIDTLALGAGGFGVVANLAPSLTAVQGLVRLTPETLAALQAFSTVTATNGANLGVLTDAAGKFAHVVQWVPAGGAAAASVAASMGTSLALVAIQIQLAQISKKVDQNIALSREVLDELQWNNEAEITGVLASVRRAYGEAASIGAVTEPVYGEIRGKEALILKARELLARRIVAYTHEIDQAKSGGQRRTWVQNHAERAMTDLQALVQIHQAWYVFQALRAASVAESDRSPRGIQLVERIRTAAVEENAEVVHQMIELADRLQRQLGLLEEADNGRLGHFRSAREARVKAAGLRSRVVTTLPDLDGGQPTSARVMLGEAEALERACRLLRYVGGGSSQPELAVQCKLHGQPGWLSSLWWDGSTSAFLFVTADELIVARESRLLGDQEIDRRIRLADVQHVRTSAADRDLEVRTADDTFTITLPEEDAPGRAQADHILRRLPLAYYSSQLEGSDVGGHVADDQTS